MYIYPRRHPWRTPILIGCLAFTCTIGAILLVALVQFPQQLSAALSFARRTPTDLVLPTATFAATTQPRVTATLRARKTPTSPPTLAPTSTPVNLLEHFMMGRPVPLNAEGIIPQWFYLYGDTQQGQNAVHHGEEFVNPVGTPVLAVADGTVVVAGDDGQPRCGDEGDVVCGYSVNFYGNLVVVQHDETFEGQRLFSLCGHMNDVTVQVGQHVHAGEQVGTVGDTGIAQGPHCHFEVRLGVNDYAHTRNPILWMKPLAGRGAIAGRVQDRSGNLVRGINVFLYTDEGSNDYVQDTETYARDNDNTPLVNSDDRLGENWAMGDLKAGKYLLRARIGALNYQKHITVQDGKLTFVVLGGE